MKIVRGWKTPDISSSKKHEMLSEALVHLLVSVGLWVIMVFLTTDAEYGLAVMTLQWIGFCRTSATQLVTFVYLIALLPISLGVLFSFLGFVHNTFQFQRLAAVTVIGYLAFFFMLSDLNMKTSKKFFKITYTPIVMYIGDKLEVHGFDRDKTDFRFLREYSKCSP